jgi:hypothetical protein
MMNMQQPLRDPDFVTGPGSKRGSRIPVPIGETPESLFRKITVDIENGMTAEEACAAAGVGAYTYRRARKIILLVANTNLSVSDRATVESAMHMMNKECVITHPYQMVADIAKRVWGKHHPRKRAEGLRIEGFNGAIGALVQMCESLSTLDIPYIEAREAHASAVELVQAITCLTAFLQRILELHQ